MKIYFHTFGCKVNQYETELLRERFALQGGLSTENLLEAELCLINSCAVTADAEQKCRQFIRRLIRLNPLARIILTGCYPQLSVDKLKTIFPSIEIFSQREKNKIAEIIFPGKGDPTSPETISQFASHERAFVKIQDGCQTKCSYCVVPFARPNLWFQSKEKAINEARKLMEAGYKEIVLTGIRLGSYPRLLPLLEELESLAGLERIRLSSLEITEVSDGLIDLMRVSRKIARHLHLPLQSGDKDILKAMKRWYTPDDFARRVEKLRQKIANIGITSDVIVGFPGEGEKNFQQTYQLIEALALSGLHVFSFSPRQGTNAAGFSGQVNNELKKDRYQRLKMLDNNLRANFIRKFVAQKVEVLVEGKQINNLSSGFSSQYFRVCFPADMHSKNKLVSVQVKSVTKNIAVGCLNNS